MEPLRKPRKWLEREVLAVNACNLLCKLVRNCLFLWLKCLVGFESGFMKSLDEFLLSSYDWIALVIQLLSHGAAEPQNRDYKGNYSECRTILALLNQHYLLHKNYIWSYFSRPKGDVVLWNRIISVPKIHCATGLVTDTYSVLHLCN